MYVQTYIPRCTNLETRNRNRNESALKKTPQKSKSQKPPFRAIQDSSEDKRSGMVRSVRPLVQWPVKHDL